MGGAMVAQGENSSILGTFQNLVKPFVGAGILALPYAYYQGGIVASTIMIMCMAVMAVYCIQCLLACLELLTSPGYGTSRQLKPSVILAAASTASGAAHPTPSYQAHAHVQHHVASSSPSSSPLLYGSSSDSLLLHDSQAQATSHLSSSSSSNSTASSSLHLLRTYTEADPPSFREIGYAAFGKVGMYALDVSLAASQLGFCATYMNFVGSTMPTVISQVTDTQWILLMFALQCVLCQIRRISTIAFTSTLGNLVYAVSIVIIFYIGFSTVCCSEAPKLKLVDASGLPSVFGTACFALEGIGLVLPVKFSMSLENRPRFNTVLYAAVLLVTTLYVVFGGLGYLFFGEGVRSPITNNLNSWSVVVVNASLSLSLFFSYIIQLYPVMEMSDGIVQYLVRRKMMRDAGLTDEDLAASHEEVTMIYGDADPMLSSGGSGGSGGSGSGATVVYREGMRSDVVHAPFDPNTVSSSDRKPPTPFLSRSGNSADAHVVATSSGMSPGGSSIFSSQRSLLARDGSASPGSASSSSSSSSFFSPSSSSSSAIAAHNVSSSQPSHVLAAALESPAMARRVFIYECTLRVLIVAFTALVALVVPNMKFLIDLTGALANSMIAFVLPTMYYLKLVVHPEYPLFDSLLVGEPLSVRLRHYRPWIVPCIVIVVAIAASVIGVESTIASVL